MLFRKSPRPARRSAVPVSRFRPQVEALECRLTPSVYQVTTTNDGTGTVTTNGHAGTIADPYLATTLRAAINAANLDGSTADTINFATTVEGGTITLTSSTLELKSRTGLTTIDGSSMGVTVDGNHTRGVFKVDSGASATLNDLTITHGKAIKGGGISNLGTLTLMNSTVSNNSSTGASGDNANEGGGIYNNGMLMLTNSIVTTNTASGGEADYGGGIANDDSGTLTLMNSTVSYNTSTGGTDNYGGGIVSIGTLTLSNSTVSNNSATDGLGGGIWVGGMLTLTNSTLTNNSAAEGGGIYNDNSLTVTNSTFTNNSATGDADYNQGGGIYNYATMSVENSTFTNNSATGGNAYNVGGAIYNDGTLTLTNSTLASNSVSGTDSSENDGGGIENDVQMTLTNCTLADNSATGSTSYGGGIDNDGNLTLTNTIVAYSTGADVYENTYGSISGSNNLVKDGSDGLSDTIQQDPLLGSLGYYGGPTQTLPLLPGSPALNAGVATNDPDTSAPLTTDQRGFAVDSPNPDIGAYQLQSSPFLVTTADDPGQQVGLLSLREAINLANVYSAAGYSPDITFNTGISTITLTTGVLELTAVESSSMATVTIDGSPTGVTVDGNHTSEVFLVDSKASATLNDLTITHGLAPSSETSEGGGILNNGTLTLTNCTVSYNSDTATSEYDAGGGIANEGTLTLMNSTVSNNSATGTYNYGGGILNDYGATLMLTNSTVSNNSATGSSNYGGGIYNDGTLTLTNSSVSNNTATATSTYNQGGGIYNDSMLMLTNSTVSDNSVIGGSYNFGGGIYNGATLTVTNSTFTNNSATGSPNENGGGGIYNGATLTVTNSTFANNSATGPGYNEGGGILNDYGTLTLTNSTVASNSVSGTSSSENYGGGIENNSRMTLTNCTVADNSATGGTYSQGGGIYNDDALTLTNTIVADSSSTGGDLDAGMYTTISGSNNLIDDGSGGLSGTIDANPLLANLGSYGGPTETMPLLPGSPALKAGITTDFPGTSTPITTDQRGFAVDSPTPDIGAYQTQANPFVVTSAADPGPVAGLVTLREAVALANAYSAAGNSADITFAPAISSITLTAGVLELTAAKSNSMATVTIDGGTAGVTVSGNQASEVFSVDENALAILNDLTITQGVASDGGGILNEGTLTLTDCTVANNSATGVTNSEGGGLFNQGTLTLTNSTVANNSATGAATYNVGGGIFDEGTLTLTDCTVANNSTTGGTYSQGGGIYNNYFSTVTLTNCTLGDNSSTGGTSNQGGGIYNFTDGMVTLTNCTLADNTITTGAGNTGGGIYNHTNSTLTLSNTIVAYSTGGDIAQNGSISGSHNLVDDGSDGLSDTIKTDPLLASLGYYGGPTQTMALLPGSPALNAGTTADYPGTSTPITTDQRGFALDSPKPDIGAYQMQANSFVVTTATDPGLPGLVSLRAAVDLANVYSSVGDSADITFNTGITSITLTAGVLELKAVKSSTTATVTIDGSPAGVTVDGNQTSGVFEVDSGASATLNDLTITHGVAYEGGGILTAGTLTLKNSTVSYNTATGGNYDSGGGGISNFGTLTVTNCIVSYNTATGGNYKNGGGIYSTSTLTVTNSTVSYNSATGGGTNYGGGIYVEANGGDLTLTNSTIANNSVYGTGGSNNVGGGIFDNGVVTVTNSTLTYNSATGGNSDAGGGIEDAQYLTMTNSTLAYNSATGGFFTFGGGINIENVTTLTNCTLAYNSESGGIYNGGGGIFNDGGNLTLTNTIVAYSRGEDVDEGAESNIIGSNNLVQDGSDGLSDTIQQDPLLGSLGYYGGPTETMPLLPGSPALNKGIATDDPITSMPITTDQRGFAVDSPTPDIGAYQLQSNPFLVTTATDPGHLVGLLSLREAVNLANVYSAAGNSAHITFNTGINSITLTAGVLELTAVETSSMATVTIDGGSAGVTVDGNHATEVFKVDANASATLKALTITHGSAEYGGGISNNGTLTLTNSTVSYNCAMSSGYNYGGGIYNTGTLTLTDSTVAYNSAKNGGYNYGGGIYNGGTLTLTNSTIAYNSATGGTGDYGGGIWNDYEQTLTSTNSTLAYNSASGGSYNNGGGIFNNVGTLTLTNTIVAYSMSTGGDIDNNAGTLNGSHNLIDDGQYGLTDTIVMNPKLGSLANNGGLTQTFALLAGSPAIDAGSDTVLSSPYNLTTDQRGLSRQSGAHVDIGSFEAQVPVLTHFYVLYGNGLKYDLLGSTRMDLPWQITGIQTVYSTTVNGNSSSLSGFSVTSFSGSGTTTLTWKFAALADVDVAAKLAGTGGNAITSGDGQGLASGVGVAAGTGVSQSVKVLYGDVNGDGVVNSTDIADVQAAILGKSVPVANNFLDVNGDGVVDSNDLTAVRTRSGHKLV